MTQASANDVIELTCSQANCVFSGVLNTGLDVTKSLTIKAAAGKTVSLDAMSQNRVLSITGSVTVVLENLSLVNGLAVSGAAVKIIDATATLTSCEVIIHSSIFAIHEQHFYLIC